MQTKILASLMIVGLASATAGVGLFAFFSDQADSIGNTINTATVNVEIDNEDSFFYTFTNILPGECSTQTIDVRNIGTRVSDGSLVLDIAADVTADHSGDEGFMSDLLNLDVTYGGGASLPPATLGNWDDTAITGLTDPGVAGTTLSVELCLDTSAGNTYQDSEVTFSLRFLLRQVAGPVISS